MCNNDRIARLLASVEREEYEEIERPRGAFSRQLFVEEDVNVADSENDDDGGELENNLEPENGVELNIENHEEIIENSLFDDTDDLDEMPLNIRKNEWMANRRNGNLVYFSKSKSMLWDVRPQTQNRTRARNILRMRMGHVDRSARDSTTASDVWKLFFTEEILTEITENTNIWIEINRPNFSRERDCKTTTVTEVRAVIGLLYLAARMKSSHENLKDLYETDGTGLEMFPLIMSRNRLSFLLRALRFDNVASRQERKLLDKLAPIRNIFEDFNENCLKNYVVSEFVTIDEMLESFRGRCSFRVYMKSKPAKYGIKIFSMACARTFYTSKMEVYVGKQPDGPFAVDNSGMGVVDRLVESISGSHRNVTVDNWFCSVPLCVKLLTDHDLTLVGTLRKNKKEIPPIFLEKRPVGSSIFGFKKACTLVSYQAKQNKNVLLLSSMHDDDSIDRATGKPEIILFYNSSKGGVDTVDKYKETYSVARTTNRWPMRIFYSMLDVAGLNSFIILKENLKEPKMIRRSFLKDLAKELCRDHMIARLDARGTPTWIKSRIRKFFGIEVPQPQLANPEENTSGRCFSCDWRKNRLSKTKCHECRRFICREHSAPARCIPCAAKEDVEEEMDESE